MWRQLWEMPNRVLDDLYRGFPFDILLYEVGNGDRYYDVISRLYDVARKWHFAQKLSLVAAKHYLS